MNDQISFQAPFHGMCTEHQAILYFTDQSIASDWIDFNSLSISEMPDVILLKGKRFKYGGVSDGRAGYMEEKEE